jgi:hypothetical protein
MVSVEIATKIWREFMTPENLNLYRQLSETKIYRERMGILREGDIASFHNSAPELITISLQSDFEDPDTFPDWIAKWKWLPPVFDCENPERCLWGMVDWKIFDVGGVRSKDNFIFLLDRFRTYYPDRLDIALIRAILKQEEV